MKAANRMKWKRVMTNVVAATVLASAPTARAEEPGWQFRIAPYAWGLGIKRDVGVGALVAPVDVEFLDAIEDLDLAGMLAAEANNGTFGVLLNGMYMKLGSRSETPGGSLDVDVEEWVFEACAVYRVVKSAKTSVDAGLGARAKGIEITLDPARGEGDVGKSKQWTDPILVARVRQQFTEKWFGMVTGDVGGFGSASDLTWSVTAATGYAFNDTVAALFGYRYLDCDYEDGAFTFDAAESGLALGLQFQL